MPVSAEARALEARIHKVMKDAFGDQVTALGGQADDVSLTLRFKFNIASSPEQHLEALRAQFTKLAWAFDLQPSDIDLPLTVNGQSATLWRIEPNRPKSPFILKTADGKLWKGRPDHFLAARARATKAA